MDLINKYQPADEKREQGKVVESRVRGLKAFNEILFAKLNKARFNLKIEQQSENRTISNQPNRYDSITKNIPLQEYRQLIVNLLVEDWHKNDCSWPNGLNRRIWNQLKNLKNEGEQIIEGFNDDYVNFTDDNGGTISIHKGDSWNQALRSLKPYAKKELSQY